MRIVPRALAAVVVFAMSGLPLLAKDTAYFDPNQDGKICRGEEAKRYARYLAVKSKGGTLFLKSDGNKDGLLSPAEHRRFEAAIKEEQAINLLDINDQLDTSKCLDLKVLTETNETTPAKPIKIGNLMVRRNHEQITLLQAERPLRSVQGALLSYNRNFQDNEEIWAARGAVLYPFEILNIPSSPSDSCSTDNFRLSAVSLTPSLSFDRVTNRKIKKRDVNSLTYRLGTQFEFCGGPLFDTQYLTIWGTYSTDFEHDSEILAVEADYQPFANVLGLGGANFILNGAASYRWLGAAHVEYGDVIDPGSHTKIVQNQEFLRWGPKVGFDFWVEEGPLERLHFYANYTHFDDLKGTNDKSQLFTTGMEYPLDAFEQFLLKAEFRKGDVPLVKDTTDEITAGFGIKF